MQGICAESRSCINYKNTVPPYIPLLTADRKHYAETHHLKKKVAILMFPFILKSFKATAYLAVKLTEFIQVLYLLPPNLTHI